MSGTPRFVVETLGTLFIALLAMFLTTSPEGLGRAIPVLGVVALAAQRLVPVMQQLYSSWAAIAGGRASVSDALDLLEQSMEEERRMPSGSLPFLTEIRLENLSFAYSPSLPEVLHCVDLIIPKGSRLGIIGETGSGKSTFLDIVMGLLPPTRGQMKVDGAALTPDRMPVWQRQIAHVPQSIFLADTTVAENIAFGLPPDEIDHDRVVTAAVIAQVDEVIRALPSGYQTRVGERGVRLSGGQRQRLGIARALYKQASVIVLDEATSALDHETERAVMDAIHSLPEKITLLIVAHRYSTLQECNSVIRLRNGGLEKVQDFKSVLVGQGSSSEE
jgi:ATP-binding cassette subfamily B protein